MSFYGVKRRRTRPSWASPKSTPLGGNDRQFPISKQKMHIMALQRVAGCESPLWSSKLGETSGFDDD